MYEATACELPVVLTSQAAIKGGGAVRILGWI
jgi:hypothetical protein